MYFFDTYAVIEMILQNPKYMPYSGFTVIVSPLNLGELYIFLARTYGVDIAQKKYSEYSFSVIDLTKEIMADAAKFKLNFPKKKYSWADSVGFVAASKQGLKFLTGDSEFKGMKNVEFVA